MKSKQYSLSLAATGASPWHVVNSKQSPFDIGFGCNMSGGGSGTYLVEHGFTDFKRLPCTISRTTTTATMTLMSHGLKAGDSLSVQNAGAPFDGVYPVASVVDANTVTYTVANSGAAASVAGSFVVPIRVFPYATGAATASSDGNYAFPINCMRVRTTIAGAGLLVLHINQGQT
jgi:hypothetical protein